MSTRSEPLALLATLPTLRAPDQEPAPREPTATEQHEKRRALVAILGEDGLSGDLSTALKRDRTLPRQLVHEFVVVQIDADDGAEVARHHEVRIAVEAESWAPEIDGNHRIPARVSARAE